jgi:hypothetical protein
MGHTGYGTKRILIILDMEHKIWNILDMEQAGYGIYMIWNIRDTKHT